MTPEMEKKVEGAHPTSTQQEHSKLTTLAYI